jgi:hypothetical protein
MVGKLLFWLADKAGGQFVSNLVTQAQLNDQNIEQIFQQALKAAKAWYTKTYGNQYGTEHNRF